MPRIHHEGHEEHLGGVVTGPVYYTPRGVKGTAHRSIPTILAPVSGAPQEQKQSHGLTIYQIPFFVSFVLFVVKQFYTSVRVQAFLSPVRFTHSRRRGAEKSSVFIPYPSPLSSRYLSVPTKQTGLCILSARHQQTGLRLCGRMLRALRVLRGEAVLPLCASLRV